MTEAIERAHAWSHLVLFLMIFMLALAVLKFSSPTGLAAGNETLSADGVGDLSPFLTAVGLLMGLFIAIVLAFNVGNPPAPRPQQTAPAQKNAAEPQQKNTRDLLDINRDLAKIRRQLRRY